jgi:hypothetical protein
MASKLFVDEIESSTASGISVVGEIKLSTGKAIKNAAGTALLTEAGALDNVTLGSSIAGNAGEWVLLQSESLGLNSGITSQNIGWNSSGSTSYFTSTYKLYKIIATNVRIGGNGGNIVIHYCHVGTTSLTAANYRWMHEFRDSSDNNTNNGTTGSVPDETSFNGIGGTNLHGNPAAGTAPASRWNSEITLYDPAATVNDKYIKVDSIYSDSTTPNLETWSGHGDYQSAPTYDTTNALTSINISCSGSQTLNDGNIKLYGLK